MRWGGPGYFWYEVRMARPFPQLGGGLSILEAGTPCRLGRPPGGAPWRWSGGPAASANPRPPLQAAELGGDMEPHPREWAARG